MDGKQSTFTSDGQQTLDFTLDAQPDWQAVDMIKRMIVPLKIGGLAWPLSILADILGLAHACGRDQADFGRFFILGPLGRFLVSLDFSHPPQVPRDFPSRRGPRNLETNVGS